jgi:hypothetical protein
MAVDPRKPLVFGPTGSSPTGMTRTSALVCASGASGDAVIASVARPAPMAASAAAMDVVLAPLCDSTTTRGRVVAWRSSAMKSSGSCTITGPRRAVTKCGRATCKALKEEPEPTSAMPSTPAGDQVRAKMRAAVMQRSRAAGCSRMKVGMGMSVNL